MSENSFKYTCYSNDFSCIKLIFKALNCMSNLTKSFHEELFSSAIAASLTDIVIRLLELGVDVNIKDEGDIPIFYEYSYGLTPDMITQNDIEAIYYYLYSLPETIDPEEYKECVGIAVYYSRPEIIETCFGSKIDPFAIENNKYTKTVIEKASELEYPDSLTYLLNKIKSNLTKNQLEILDKVLGNISRKPNFNKCIKLLHQIKKEYLSN